MPPRLSSIGPIRPGWSAEAPPAAVDRCSPEALGISYRIEGIPTRWPRPDTLERTAPDRTEGSYATRVGLAEVIIIAIEGVGKGPSHPLRFTVAIPSYLSATVLATVDRAIEGPAPGVLPRVFGHTHRHPSELSSWSLARRCSWAPTRLRRVVSVRRLGRSRQLMAVSNNCIGNDYRAVPASPGLPGQRPSHTTNWIHA